MQDNITRTTTFNIDIAFMLSSYIHIIIYIW